MTSPEKLINFIGNAPTNSDPAFYGSARNSSNSIIDTGIYIYNQISNKYEFIASTQNLNDDGNTVSLTAVNGTGHVGISSRYFYVLPFSISGATLTGTRAYVFDMLNNAGTFEGAFQVSDTRSAFNVSPLGINEDLLATDADTTNNLRLYDKDGNISFETTLDPNLALRQTRVSVINNNVVIYGTGSSIDRLRIDTVVNPVEITGTNLTAVVEWVE